MSPSTITAPPAALRRLDAPLAARSVLALLARLPHGTLDVTLPGGASARLGSGAAPRAAIRLHDWKPCSRVLKAGDIGFAEGFLEGEWTSSDLTALIGYLLVNRDDVERLIRGSWWGGLLNRARHLLNRNSRAGSRRNVQAHYDLGNEFYRLWLDPTMNYSAAWFEGDASRPLPQAQHAKLRRALGEAGVRPGDRVLEVGCGWGGLAEIAAGEFEAHVTGVTLSAEQLDWAAARVAAAGLAGRCELRLQDYRELAARHEAEPFDAVVSIEMFEAVGHEYWGGYFDMLRRCLKPGGRACIQSITIRDDLFDRYRRSTDFIQQYVFPGGLLPSASEFVREAGCAGLVVERSHAFGPDYAETLRRWRDAFMRRLPEVRALGFDDRFVRLWEFYLAYCEAAFEHGNTDVVQFTLRRP
jgi:cyclopropane-fatty-acyl-phospholipid synthase